MSQRNRDGEQNRDRERRHRDSQRHREREQHKKIRKAWEDAIENVSNSTTNIGVVLRNVWDPECDHAGGMLFDAHQTLYDREDEGQPWEIVQCELPTLNVANVVHRKIEGPKLKPLEANSRAGTSSGTVADCSERAKLLFRYDYAVFNRNNAMELVMLTFDDLLSILETNKKHISEFTDFEQIKESRYNAIMCVYPLLANLPSLLERWQAEVRDCRESLMSLNWRTVKDVNEEPVQAWIKDLQHEPREYASMLAKMYQAIASFDQLVSAMDWSKLHHNREHTINQSLDLLPLPVYYSLSYRRVQARPRSASRVRGARP